MAEKILMPRLSDTMTEGVIAAWHKKVGESVKKGDLLAEIETDKATMELESYKDGTILYLGTEKGGKLQVDDLLVIVGDAGEDVSSLINGKSGGNAPAPKEDKPPQQPAAEKAATSASIDVSKMDEVVLMPRLSDTMTDGVIAGWAKNVGDQIKKGDLLAEIETDKATMELESYKNGTLLYQGAKKGDKILVNDLLCIIGEAGKVDVDAIVAAVKGGTSVSASSTQEVKAEEPVVIENETVAETSSNTENGRLIASPLAKKLAAEKGIDLNKVQGSGDGGRIVKSDIDNYTPATQTTTPTTASPAAAVAAAPAGQVSFEDTSVSQMRKVIAKRLAESKFTAPHFYLTMSINMDNAVASRGKINETAPVKISFNDLVLKACALALKQHPTINSSWLGDTIRTNHHVNIGVAVAVPDGLLVPVVRFADTKSLSQIAVEVKDFVKKAKDKKLQPSDWEGSTFTISNLGMFGIDEFTAIINPPDACILAIGGISQVPVVKNGAVVPGNIMKVTLSCDHRVVDGASGAAFLQTLKNLLEEPLRMLV
ncbi:MAG TPA: pyruvate dehydrogenase complex dihydrolipoamide acetyltransferase [Niabella sp.]|nr:pyruvate dehydrogenase complex dihydrolipoamide acetyltransferase [Niabella sp.]HOZ97138.1 pyruvate dehydrogenase complex dihydrolipoamide acetyltransferase [Niabella sp.]HQW15338.1 pyruvate dehydrogenase complex dihydrolipoamide acetyltransferase [Niabella sp.]HQX20412.1 pyruvate dehydrogenase complex dihydrolipoamide acetyltransferase [Niabella sp.]HQX41003.1 pyruvate dehydrogenase complex dihydrolipoamide acetyltransferase [Niabella sp.]